MTASTDCTVSDFGKKIEILGEPPARTGAFSLVDTGTWRNIGQRLLAVKSISSRMKRYFSPNYSDGADRRSMGGDDQLLQKERPR